jgi:hypothetical protein
MPAKSDKPSFFTELQLQRLKRTTHNLRKLNRDSLRALQRLKHPGLTNTKYREAGNSFEILALRVISALRFREAVLSSARDQRIDVIVHVEVICTDCRHQTLLSAPTASDQTPPDNACEALKQDPVHQAEVNTLLELAHLTNKRMSARSMSPTTRKALMTSLRRLMEALLKQRRHLQDTSDDAPGRCEMRVHPSVCCVCQKPTGNRNPNRGQQLTLHESSRELDPVGLEARESWKTMSSRSIDNIQNRGR